MADAGHPAWNVLKSLAVLAVLWAVFLLVLPMTISVVEIDLGIQRFPPPALLATTLLVVCTTLALWAVLTLAIVGGGTPLPFNPTQRLVASGPYAHMRHPLATAMTGQIVALGIALGSIPVIGYAVVFMTLWYFLIRKREERGLEKRFGRPARDYITSVRAFRPRLRPYRAVK